MGFHRAEVTFSNLPILKLRFGSPLGMGCQHALSFFSKGPERQKEVYEIRSRTVHQSLQIAVTTSSGYGPDNPGFWQSRGLSERCEVVAGDFFTSVPRGDTYVLKWMIHDWDDQRSAALLKNCRSAMSKEEEKMKTPLVVALVGLAISFALPTLLLRH